MSPSKPGRFDRFMEKAFWSMLLGIIGFGVNEIHDLNTKMLKILETIAVHEIRLQDLEKHR